MKSQKLFFFLVSLLSILSPIILINAQEISYLDIPGAKDPTASLPSFIYYIYVFGAISAGFLAVLMIIIGGLKLIIAGGNPRKIVDGRDQILKAIMGMLLIFFSFFILITINPDLIVLQEPSILAKPPEEEVAIMSSGGYITGPGDRLAPGTIVGGIDVGGSLNVPYIFQHDPKFKGMFSKGCAYVSTTMLINYYRKPHLTPSDVKEVMGDNGTGDSIRAIEHFLPDKKAISSIYRETGDRDFGLNLLEDAEEEIKQGDPVLVGTNRPFAATRHVMVIVGFTKDRNVITHDPNGTGRCNRPFLNKEGRDSSDGTFLVAERNQFAKAMRYIIRIDKK